MSLMVFLLACASLVAITLAAGWYLLWATKEGVRFHRIGMWTTEATPTRPLEALAMGLFGTVGMFLLLEFGNSLAGGVGIGLTGVSAIIGWCVWVMQDARQAS